MYVSGYPSYLELCLYTCFGQNKTYTTYLGYILTMMNTPAILQREITFADQYFKFKCMKTHYIYTDGFPLLY